MKVTAAVDRLRRDGVEVWDFGAGEPDFPTPSAISQAAHAAIDGDFTKYTPVGGTIELKRAIIARYKADYGVEYRELAEWNDLEDANRIRIGQSLRLRAPAAVGQA